jgi:thymidylate synthase (FAD)
MAALSEEAKYLYERIVTTLTSQGIKRKQAREAARSVLPNNLSTDIVVSGNHRAWRDMLQKRYSIHADAEIRELATEILALLRSIAPGSFQDFPDTPFS